MMKSVKAWLDDLHAGTAALDEVAADFAARTWPPVPRADDAAAHGVVDDPVPPPDSWADVDADSRLSAEQYQVLAQAYARARARQAADDADPDAGPGAAP